MPAVMTGIVMTGKECLFKESHKPLPATCRGEQPNDSNVRANGGKMQTAMNRLKKKIIIIIIKKKR